MIGETRLLPSTRQYLGCRCQSCLAKVLIPRLPVASLYNQIDSVAFELTDWSVSETFVRSGDCFGRLTCMSRNYAFDVRSTDRHGQGYRWGRTIGKHTRVGSFARIMSSVAHKSSLLARLMAVWFIQSITTRYSVLDHKPPQVITRNLAIPRPLRRVSCDDLRIDSRMHHCRWIL